MTIHRMTSRLNSEASFKAAASESPLADTAQCRVAHMPRYGAVHAQTPTIHRFLARGGNPSRLSGCVPKHKADFDR